MTEFCHMQVLVIAATELEIAPFLAENILCDHLITGVGAPSALYHLQKKLNTKKYDCVIQAGIAGSFSPAIALGETVLVDKDIFADLGMFENNRLVSFFDTGFIDKNEAPYKNGWLLNDGDLLTHFPLPKHTGITVNTVSENNAMTGEYKRLYQPAIESMEGAALHYVCLMEGIPFIQLRSISNAVGERDKSKWKIAAAVQNLNNHLLELVSVLNKHA